MLPPFASMHASLCIAKLGGVGLERYTVLDFDDGASIRLVLPEGTDVRVVAPTTRAEGGAVPYCFVQAWGKSTFMSDPLVTVAETFRCLESIS